MPGEYSVSNALAAAATAIALGIDAAKAAASRLLEEQETVASQKAEEIVRKARQLAELEQQKEREALKEQFGQLVALAAAQVTGKMLTEEDQRRINREAIDSLDS